MAGPPPARQGWSPPRRTSIFRGDRPVPRGSSSSPAPTNDVPFRARPTRDRLLNRLVKRAPPAELRADEVLFRAGDPADEVVLVREGHLVVSRGGPDAPALDLVLPWEIGGDDALVRNPGPRREALRAGAPAVVQRLDGRAVRRVLRRAEGTFDAFWVAARERLALQRRLRPDRSARSRLAALLLHLAERATAEGKGSALEFPYACTHATLAELAALHRSTVTTILNDWLFDGLVEKGPVGWRIPNPEALGEE